MMVHFPGHKRAAFTKWLEQGAPPRAVIEENYQEHEVSARTLLKRTLDCTDTLPKAHRETVAGLVGFVGTDPGLSYGDAATVLLIADAAGHDAALAYLYALVEPNADEPVTQPPWHQDEAGVPPAEARDEFVVCYADWQFDQAPRPTEIVHDDRMSPVLTWKWESSGWGWELAYESEPGEPEEEFTSLFGPADLDRVVVWARQEINEGTARRAELREVG